MWVGGLAYFTAFMETATIANVGGTNGDGWEEGVGCGMKREGERGKGKGEREAGKGKWGNGERRKVKREMGKGERKKGRGKRGMGKGVFKRLK